MPEFHKGVSLIICTFNGANLLGETIKHVLKQNVPPEIEWEFLLIDNASTDNTQEIVRNLWDSDVPCRIIYEGEKGLINARNRGINEAEYEYISFIDDDNWVDENWVSTIYDIFTTHPEIGLCGGQIEGAFELQPPAWFKQIQESYAIGKQGEQSGDVTESRGFLWGAGLSLRKSAFLKVKAAGFSPILTGRKGNTLLAGEDTEICYVMRLAGWRLWYHERLKMKHYITARRMEWDYIMKMYRGFGYSHAVFEIYYRYLLNKGYNYLRIWFKSFLEVNYYIFWRLFHLFSKMKGNPERLRARLYFSKFYFTTVNYSQFRRYNKQIREYYSRINTATSLPGDHHITIVTVSMNNRAGLENTIRSVISQQKAKFEFIVVDGGSHDGSAEIIEQYRQDLSAWISEPDKGPYDAMNKGIAMSKGEWIIFLNSGDIFHDNLSLSQMAELIADHNTDAVYGDNLADYHDFYVYRKAGPMKDIWKGMVLSHQALLIRKSLVKEKGFNIKLSKIADYELILRRLPDPERVRYLSSPVVICDAYGISVSGQAAVVKDFFRISRQFNTMTLSRRFYFLKTYILASLIDFVKMILPEGLYFRMIGLLKGHKHQGNS